MDEWQTVFSGQKQKCVDVFIILIEISPYKKVILIIWVSIYIFCYNSVPSALDMSQTFLQLYYYLIASI